MTIDEILIKYAPDLTDHEHILLRNAIQAYANSGQMSKMSTPEKIMSKPAKPVVSDELEEKVLRIIWARENGERIPMSIVNRQCKELKQLLHSYGDKRELDGMQKAKSRVLRRTEIPADAKNPTRDYVVILGEQIANIIEGDIAELKQQRGKV